MKKETKKLRKFSVAFKGRAYVRGVIEVKAANEQDARSVAFAKRLDDGIEWHYDGEDEEYAPRILHISHL